MRVVIYEHYDGALHGNQRHIALLANWLCHGYEHEIDLMVLVNSRRELYQALAENEVPVQTLSRSGLRRMIDMITRIRQFRPDVMVCNNQRSLLAALVPALLTRTPVIWGIKDFRRFFLLDRICFMVASRVLAIAPQCTEVKGAWVSRRFGHKIYCLPIGIPVEQFVALPQPREARVDHVSALMLSAIAPGKGLEVAIDAMRRVGAHRAKIALRIAGACADRQGAFSERIVAESKDIGNIHWLGWQNDIPALLRDADIVVLPSYSEGVPRSLVEAMAAGRPVVASRVGGIPSLVEDGVTGILIEPGDGEGLARALLKLAEDPEMRRTIGNAARQYVRRHHDFAQHIALLKRHCAEVAGLA